MPAILPHAPPDQQANRRAGSERPPITRFWREIPSVCGGGDISGELGRWSKVGRAKAERCPTSFPEAGNIGQFRMARPIRRIYSVFHEAVKARMGPIRHAGDVPVFDRIVMDVIAMAFKISVITNLVFPITVLPNCLFAFVAKRGRAWGFERGVTIAGEVGFDPHPAG